PTGEGGEHWRADRDAKCIEADQQAGRRKTDLQVGRDGGNQANDDELRRSDGECADRQRKQGNGHEGTPCERQECEAASFAEKWCSDQNIFDLKSTIRSDQETS